MATYHFSNKPHATLKSGEKMNVQTHFEYICREGKYSHMRDRSQEKLTAVSFGNMPAWAYDKEKGKIDARKFWTEDENNRDKNARGYREIRIALMEELSDKENIELVETFLKRSGIKDKHVYSYAIHDKKAAFDSNHRNIHVHIMFNEKILENDRPLSADQFFKKYSYRKDGTPIGGYKVSRYYSSREATLSMRKLWEDIANEKFREKGLDTRITCKSLKAQKEEAEENMDYLKADMADRSSGPHLGSLYRNPRTMAQIQSLVRDFTKAINNPQEEERLEERLQALGDDEDQQKIILFSQDLALRNMARAIEERQKKERSETRQRAIAAIEEKENKEQEESIRNTPWGVTMSDVVTYIEEEIEKIKKENDTAYRTYSSIFVPEMTKEKAVLTAMDALTKGQYSRTKEETENLAEDYETYSRQEKDLIKDSSPGAAERYSNFLKERQLLLEKLEQKETELATIESFLGEDAQKAKLEDMARQIWDNHLKAKNAQLQALETIGRIQNRHILLDRQRSEARQEAAGQLLYATALPGVVTRKDNLYGVIPVRKLPVYVKDGRQYAVTEETGKTATAICLNEKTDNGYAGLYAIGFRTDELSGKKRIETVDKTTDKVPLFQSYSKLLETIRELPKAVEHYKKKLAQIRLTVEEEYKKLFQQENKGASREKEAERFARNKDPDKGL